MTYVGGVRSRLIRQSLIEMLTEALTELGWFDADNTLLSPENPLRFAADALEWDEEIPLNTISLADEDLFLSEAELGSNLTEERWTYVVDVYAENKSVGIHLANDIKTILDGRMPSIGRGEPHCMVKDYAGNGDDLFYVDIENVTLDRATGWSKVWQKNWYFVSFDVIDVYGTEGND